MLWRWIWHSTQDIRLVLYLEPHCACSNRRPAACVCTQAHRRRQGALAVIRYVHNAQYYVAQEAAKTSANSENGGYHRRRTWQGKAPHCCEGYSDKGMARNGCARGGNEEVVEECVGHRIGKQHEVRERAWRRGYQLRVDEQHACIERSLRGALELAQA